jgi:uncharacterized protein YeaO (DUF488 family)
MLDEDGRIRERPPVEIRRVYDVGAPEPDEVRVLVDRIWPRGVSKQSLRLGAWFRDLAPSDELRRWFGHDANRWNGFRERYRSELAANPERLGELAALRARGRLVLLYSARDEEHNQAVVLREVLEASSRAAAS